MKQKSNYSLLYLGAVITASLILAVVFSNPLYKYFTKGIPSRLFGSRKLMGLEPADHLPTFAHLWEIKDSLEKGKSPLPIYHEFNLKGVKRFRKHNPIKLAYRLVGVALAELTGSTILGYNLSVILSFPLAALSAYLFLSLFSEDKLVNFFLSLFYSVLPYRLAHLYIGHWNGFIAYAIPLFYFSVCKYLQAKKIVVKFLFFLVGFFAVSSMGQHTHYYSTLYLPFVVLLYLTSTGKFKELVKKTKQQGLNNKTLKSWLVYLGKTLVVLLPFFVLMIIPGIQNKLRISESGYVTKKRTLQDIFNSSYNPEFPEALFQRENSVENIVYLGLPLMVLFTAAYIINTFFVKKKSFNIYFHICLFTLTGLSLLLIFPSPINLVHSFFYQFVPFFKLNRTPARAFYFFFLFLMTVLSLQLSNIFKKYLKETKLLLVPFILISLLILLDYRVSKNIRVEELPKLQTQPAEQNTLGVPVLYAGHHLSSFIQYYYTQTGDHFVNGYAPVVNPEYQRFYPKVQSINYGFFTASQCRILQNQNVSDLVVFTKTLGMKNFLPGVDVDTTINNLKADPKLTLVAEDMENQIYQFRITNCKEQELSSEIKVFRVLFRPENKTGAVSPPMFVRKGEYKAKVQFTEAPEQPIRVLISNTGVEKHLSVEEEVVNQQQVAVPFTITNPAEKIQIAVIPKQTKGLVEVEKLELEFK